MPVRHITFHAYRSWNADHPDGYLQHGDPERKSPSKELADHRNRHANHPEVAFTPEQQQAIIFYVHDICGRRNWSPYAICANATHVHIVVAWRDATTADDVETTLKRVLGYLLAKEAQTTGKPWFSHGNKSVPVAGKTHLKHLLDEYLPMNHGHYWRAKWDTSSDHPADLND